MSDQELLARIASGDREAFAAFYDRHAPRVLGLLVHLLHDRNEAEDLLQVTFFQVWSRAGQYDAARARPDVWLFLIARSRALDHLGRARPPVVEPAEDDLVTSADPASALERTEASHKVREALAQLPEEQRSAITLAFFGGLTHQQVARHQALPLGTVKTRIRLGMNRLRGLLRQPEEVSAP